MEEEVPVAQNEQNHFRKERDRFVGPAKCKVAPPVPLPGWTSTEDQPILTALFHAYVILTNL